jgi:hypothetical protein
MNSFFGPRLVLEHAVVNQLVTHQRPIPCHRTWLRTLSQNLDTCKQEYHRHWIDCTLTEATHVEFMLEISSIAGRMTTHLLHVEKDFSFLSLNQYLYVLNRILKQMYLLQEQTAQFNLPADNEIVRHFHETQVHACNTYNWFHSLLVKHN